MENKKAKEGRFSRVEWVNMGYLFLTGATGLLGSYLIRDLLRSGTQLAVLVRPTKFESAQHRMETLVARWEKQAGHPLPRPVVLAGDISRADLGLKSAGLEWVARSCDAMMHNAASLTFHSESRDDEPWRSNLDGTRHVLDFCRRTGIRNFHHVSTAYVCGLRQDRILENELDVGQDHGNDYEISKFEAEKLVRGADFLDRPTVYRPSIILGDSQNGYTTTFHGFYVPLKLVSTLISRTAGITASREMVTAGIKVGGKRLREILQFNGDECKNYVPVDWVSAVMTHIFTHSEHHGETYHLTPHHRVPIAVMQDVIEQIFLKFTELTSRATETTVNWEKFEPFFLEGMNVYRSYWRGDPEFDTANTQRAAPHLPCPEVDAAMLTRLCRFAIESNFGWPKPQAVKPEFDLHKHLQGLVDVHETTSVSGQKPVFVGLQVNGRGGGQWELALRDGAVASAEQGLSARCTATYYLNSKTFERLSTRELSVEQALQTGRVLIEGNGVPLKDLARILSEVVADDDSNESAS